MSPNLRFFGSNRRVFVRRRVGEQMISACVVLTVKHRGGDVMLWGSLLMTLSAISSLLFYNVENRENKDTLE
jgi:hypothetical protein